MTCIANNEGGRSESSVLLEIDRKVNLELIAEPTDTEAIQGSTVQMPCTADSKDVTV